MSAARPAADSASDTSTSTPSGSPPVPRAYLVVLGTRDQEPGQLLAQLGQLPAHQRQPADRPRGPRPRLPAPRHRRPSAGSAPGPPPPPAWRPPRPSSSRPDRSRTPAQDPAGTGLAPRPRCHHRSRMAELSWASFSTVDLRSKARTPTTTGRQHHAPRAFPADTPGNRHCNPAAAASISPGSTRTCDGVPAAHQIHAPSRPAGCIRLRRP